MTREEAINEIKSWAIPSRNGREVLETLIPELAESEDESLKNKSGYYKAGKFWKASTLWNATKNKIPQRVSNRYILQECTWNIGTLQRFADEVKNVQEVSLDYPIILDMNGNIIDGAHRVVKAYLEGKDIDIVYLGDDEWPEPDYDEEKAVKESEDERIRKHIVKFIDEQYPTHGNLKEEKDKMLAYIEKQKESLHIPETCKENADSFTEDERIRQWLYNLVDEGAYLCERPCATESILAYLEKQKQAQTAEEKEYIRTIKSIISDFIRDKKPEYMGYYQRICDWLDGRHIPFSCGHENGKPADPVFSKQEYESHSIVSTVNSEYDKGYMDGKAFQLKQTEQYSIGKTFMGLIPCWVNAPSTLQPAHKYHGKNAVIMHENNGGFRCCFIDDEKATTIHLPENTLFVEGWRKKPAEQRKATINGEPIPTENHSVNIPLAEWSKEDEEMRGTCIDLLEHFPLPCGEVIGPWKDCISWLKSLPLKCPKSSDNWKPSEEQMDIGSPLL